MKFKRKILNLGDLYAHPDGFAGIGIHALHSDRFMTIEEIMQEHMNYYKTNDGCPPSYGELIRDLGLLVCFGLVEVEEENER